jgi:hypothetical protein
LGLKGLGVTKLLGHQTAGSYEAEVVEEGADFFSRLVNSLGFSIDPVHFAMLGLCGACQAASTHQCCVTLVSTPTLFQSSRLGKRLCPEWLVEAHHDRGAAIAACQRRKSNRFTERLVNTMRLKDKFIVTKLDEALTR